ncbi:ABC transporter ATP-binding protein [Cellulomonas hominis]
MSSNGLVCEDLSFAYRRRMAPVLDGITMRFAAGALTAVTGPSGSGKSTLMYVLSLLLRPTGGRVLWDGTDLAALPDDACSRWRAGTTGFVFQDAMLDPARTVMDNICEPAVFTGLPRREARTRADALLERFGIADRAHHRPGEISGGQAQRVGLCRALLNEPALVFGDEPTGNLDDASARVVWEALAELASSGATVVVATHDERLARRADHRVTL